MQHLQSSSPAVLLSIIFYAWTRPAAVYFVFFLRRESRLYWRSWPQVCMGGLSYSPWKWVSITKSSLKANLICRLLRQPQRHFHGDSLFPESYINNLIINNAWGKGRLGVGFVYLPRQSCLVGEKFSGAGLRREIWACQDLFCLDSGLISSHSVLISISSAVTLSLSL